MNETWLVTDYIKRPSSATLKLRHLSETEASRSPIFPCNENVIGNGPSNLFSYHFSVLRDNESTPVAVRRSGRARIIPLNSS